MENHKMDELFRQRLHDAEVPPPPFVWPAVEQALQERRRRKMMWLLALGLLSAASLAWFLTRSQIANEITQSPPGIPGTSLEQKRFAAETPQAERTPNADPLQTMEPAPSVVGSVSADAGSLQETSKRTKVVAFPPQNSSARQEADNALTAKNADDLAETVFTKTNYLETMVLQAKSTEVASADSEQAILVPNNKKPVAQRKKKQPKLCYDFDKHPKAWLLDVYAGPSLAQSSLTSHPDNRPYLNQRLGTERRSVAMNAGVRASLMFNQNLLLRTGLHYDQVTEVFEYIDPTYVKLSINTVVLNGQVVRIDTIVEYGENYQKTYNRYSMLDVPLTFGVEMRRGRSGFSINAGASANVLFLARGSIIDPGTREPARFGPNSTLSQNVFQQSVGFSAMASIQWFWHVTPRTRFFVEPAFRQVLRPVTLSSHPVEQRYSILGLRLGATTIF